MSPDMALTVGALCAIVAACALTWLTERHRVWAARRRLRAALIEDVATQRALDAAKAEARDVIDQHLAETPIYAETCEAEARRIAAAELDADLRRLLDGSAS